VPAGGEAAASWAKRRTGYLKILKFDSNAHLQYLRAYVIELQDFERSIDPRLPAGSEIVDEYVPQMLMRCKSCKGQIFMAEVDGNIAGYVTVLTDVSSGELEDGDMQYGLIADLLVGKKYRGLGLGRKLIDAAESYAKDHDVEWLRIAVLAKNKPAIEMYNSSGFSSLFVELEKNLNE
jgi:ribosomal protein S18 acetylase RimI-like enzyme